MHKLCSITFHDFDKICNILKAIAAPVLAKSFNDETLIIRGETVRYVMERTAQFGINNYLALQRDCTQHWNFHNAFFFAGTVATTIGKHLKISTHLQGVLSGNGLGWVDIKYM